MLKKTDYNTTSIQNPPNNDWFHSHFLDSDYMQYVYYIYMNMYVGAAQPPNKKKKINQPTCLFETIRDCGTHPSSCHFVLETCHR
jgi:hypothetical protein